MKNNLAAVLSLCLLSFSAHAKSVSVPLSSAKSGIKVNSLSNREVDMEIALDAIDINDIELAGKKFVEISAPSLMKTFGKGTPNLPVISKLIQIPAGASAKFEIVDYDEQEINFSDLGINEQIVPAQESVSKSAKTLKAYIDTESYKIDSYISRPLAKIEDLGLMRNIRLARIEFSPFEYNPVSGVLKVRNNIKAKINFEYSQFVATFNQDYDAENFNLMLGGVIGAQRSLFQRAESPTYVIVSHRRFEKDLQRFINWKKQSGYQVIEAYTDSREVGSTNASIKSYLKNLFLNPAEGFGPQQFVLFVGDVAEVPTFQNESNYHVTDFPYAEYTNDELPDTFYGRFSANTSVELNAIIDKTLAYEMRTLKDTRFLSRSVMVAGEDSGHIPWSNGQINYGVKNYFNSAHGITSKTFLQPEPANSPHGPKIKSEINAGAGFVNYTAHCSPDGWAGPSFSIADLSKLTNADRYGVWIGNCCQSSSFDTNSFAEEAVRLPRKGAVGYIGASNYSYWDEDYWWAVGFKDVVEQPVYNPENTGVYDHLFAPANAMTKMGQMVFIGNLAVQASTSSRKVYYWEVYNVMGDPSLSVQFK